MIPAYIFTNLISPATVIGRFGARMKHSRRCVHVHVADTANKPSAFSTEDLHECVTNANITIQAVGSPNTHGIDLPDLDIVHHPGQFWPVRPGQMPCPIIPVPVSFLP